MWSYFQNCDEFKAHSKLDASLNKDESMYPYYQMQETLKISDNIIKKIVDRLFNARVVIGREKGKQSSGLEELFMILVYLDPNCFEAYFKTVIERISGKLSEIVKKEHKILTSFLSSWKANSAQS